jgi:hypothetical protein
MKNLTFKQKVAVASLAIATLSGFGCKQKPEPEKNCQDQTGAMIVCPEPIASIQKIQIDCVDRDGSMKTFDGKRIVPKTDFLGVATKITVYYGLVEIEFTSSSGVIGYTKAGRCETK